MEQVPLLFLPFKLCLDVFVVTGNKKQGRDDDDDKSTKS